MSERSFSRHYAEATGQTPARAVERLRVEAATRARRIAEEAGAFREQARGLASGLEAELSIVLDALYPVPHIFDALRAFTDHFPTVPPRLYVASLGAAANLVTDGTCAIGLLPSNVAGLTTLHLTPLTTIHLCPVVYPSHPLASIPAHSRAAAPDHPSLGDMWS